MMRLFKIDGRDPQVCGHPGDIDQNKGTDQLERVTLYRSDDNGETWDVAGWFPKNERFGGFGPEVLWVEESHEIIKDALQAIFNPSGQKNKSIGP